MDQTDQRPVVASCCKGKANSLTWVRGLAFSCIQHDSVTTAQLSFGLLSFSQANIEEAEALEESQALQSLAHRMSIWYKGEEASA